MPFKRFRTTLVSGAKRPYSSWTFVIVPPELAAEWRTGQIAVRGTISGTSFRGTASRGEGDLRIPITRKLRERAGIAAGDTVDVALDVDTEPRPLELPGELIAVLSDQPELARRFEQLPPSLRRAWVAYVEEAKRPETRLRRARKAPRAILAREFPR